MDDEYPQIGTLHLWGVVLITTSGKPLVWGAYDINAKRSKTEDVIRHIEKLMSDANEKNTNIKAFISDSAGEYAAAQYVLTLINCFM
jgi:cation transport ATPase